MAGLEVNMKCKGRPWSKITRDQAEAILKVWRRHGDEMLHKYNIRNFLQYRRLAQPLMGGGGCVMIPSLGIWLGIETDGHTHS